MDRAFPLAILALSLLWRVGGALAAPQLLVATVDDTGCAAGQDGRRLQHLLSYTLLDGYPSSPDTILSNPGSQLRFDSSRIHQDRYLISDFGDIVDLQSGECIHRGCSGRAYTKLVTVEGDRVTLYASQSSEYLAFSLSQRSHQAFEPTGRELLPGLISPDGTMSVDMAGEVGDPHELWLFRVDGDKTLLGTGFRVELSIVSSVMGLPAPRMWLDNRRILTQRSNGEIVLVSIDGSVEAVTNIDLSDGRDPKKPPSPLDAGAFGAQFYRDTDDNVIYSITAPGPKHRRFILDVANKSYREPELVWTPVGSGFDVAADDDTNRLWQIRHDGEVIGRERFVPANCRTSDGRIAFVTSDRKSVRVWTEGSAAQWAEIGYDSPVWITRSAVLGWYEAPRDN